MSLVMLKSIGDLEDKPTRMTLELVDRPIKYAYGVIKDVFVQVDKLFLYRWIKGWNYFYGWLAVKTKTTD